MLEEGDPAPNFSLRGSDGRSHSLKDFRGAFLVLYFYPKDDTMGCTLEAKCFNARMADLKKAGAEVVGVSADDLDSHERFISKYNLGFLLLSDPERSAIKRYDSYGNRGIFGWGTIRNTFIIGKDGKIIRIFRKVRPNGHDKQVLEFLKSIGA